tara:strand:+ start:550 stop:777 length:228 start_codon:yes stop_codon:yes gene_type:complete
MKNPTVNVTYISPTGRKMRSIEVPADRVYMDDSGEVLYRFNKIYPACEVIEVELVPQSSIDAKRGYFERFGTACE